MYKVKNVSAKTLPIIIVTPSPPGQPINPKPPKATRIGVNPGQEIDLDQYGRDRIINNLKVHSYISKKFFIILEDSEQCNTVSFLESKRQMCSIEQLTTRTSCNITYYVRIDGNDCNSGLSAEEALATIQAAIDRIPMATKNIATVDIGPGNFSGFYLNERIMNCYTDQDINDCSIYIKGADFIDFSPSSGTNTGTSTGGSTNTLVDEGQSWGDNELRGKLVYVNGEYLIIRKNDATSLETVGYSSETMSGQTYALKDWSTIINECSGWAQINNCIAIINCKSARRRYDLIRIEQISCILPDTAESGARCVITSGSDYGLYQVSLDANGVGCCLDSSSDRSIEYENVHTLNSLEEFGVYITNTECACDINNVLIDSCYSGIIVDNCPENSIFNSIYTDDCSFAGITYIGTRFAFGNNLCANNCSDVGLTITANGGGLSLVGGIIENNSYGVLLNADSPLDETQGICHGNLIVGMDGGTLVQNNGSGGIVIGSNVISSLDGLTGTGNGGYGIYARYGAKVLITANTTITGNSGDIKVGDLTVKSYSSDFVNDGNYIADESEGTIVKRKDNFVY